MIGARNVKAGLALIALSLVGGLAMSLYAFVPMVRVPEGLLEYDDLARRLLRLAHVAAVMLPLLNIVFGLLLDRLRLSRGVRELSSVLLLAGAVGLPLALGAEALLPAARAWHLAGPPAVAMTLGTALVSLGALRTPPADLLGFRGEDRSGC
ncbi:MAG TPA: hypothetical protein VNM14_04795 [Planctomycetota bacterium]|nr:hypothetical protein [Planctomycetota bacterium]